METVEKYYISTGETNAMYTLRVSGSKWIGGRYPQLVTFDHYVMTLTGSFDTSVDKAKKHLGDNMLHLLKVGDESELRKIERKKVDHSIIRFGKYSGLTVSEVVDVDRKYLVWCAENMSSKKHAETIKLIVDEVAGDVEKKREEERVMAEEEDRAKAAKKWVGKIGEKIEDQLIYTGSTGYDTRYGHTNIHFFVDVDGNDYIWKTAVGRIHGEHMERGEVIYIKGTIKDHGEYNGVKQNVLTRCTCKQVVTVNKKK